jgi:hypothetical protein
MTKYILTMGLFDKDSHLQEIKTVEASKILNRMVVARLGYGTITEATGIYTHENGEVVVEPSLRVEILATEDTINDVSVKSLAVEMKTTFNQESILFEKVEQQADFI